MHHQGDEAKKREPFPAAAFESEWGRHDRESEYANLARYHRDHWRDAGCGATAQAGKDAYRASICQCIRY